MTFVEALEEFLAAREAYITARDYDAPMLHLLEELRQVENQLDEALGLTIQGYTKR